MNEEIFRNYLLKTNHKKSATETRINKLKIVESYFNINIDSIIKNREQVVNLLIKIRDVLIEDSRHTPLSNAVRKYYECITGNVIGRIF